MAKKSKYDENCEQVMFKCGRHCCICRRFRPTMLQVHHIIERQGGGTDEIDNLIPVCLTCHSNTHTKRPFARRFTPDELEQHRDRVYNMVTDGSLVPPDVDAVPAVMPPSPEPVGSPANKAFVITKEGLIEPRLGNESVELLMSAAQSPSGTVLALDAPTGYAVQIEGRDLVPSQNPRDVARLRNAVEELTRHGFLQASGPELRVSHFGYLLADELDAVRSRQQ